MNGAAGSWRLTAHKFQLLLFLGDRCRDKLYIGAAQRSPNCEVKLGWWNCTVHSGLPDLAPDWQCVSARAPWQRPAQQEDLAAI